MPWLVTSLFLAFIVVIVLVTIRNERVFVYKVGLIMSIRFDDALFDEKMSHLRSVSYEQMVWKFWRKLDSFYDMKFLRR